MMTDATSPILDIPPGALIAQVANSVLAAAVLSTHRGLAVKVVFLRCEPLCIQFRATYEQHGVRHYVLVLADASGGAAKLVRLNDANEADEALFDEVDRALTSAFPDALRVTVCSFYAQHNPPGVATTHDAPADLQ